MVVLYLALCLFGDVLDALVKVLRILELQRRIIDPEVRSTRDLQQVFVFIQVT